MFIHIVNKQLLLHKFIIILNTLPFIHICKFIAQLFTKVVCFSWILHSSTWIRESPGIIFLHDNVTKSLPPPPYYGIIDILFIYTHTHTPLSTIFLMQKFRKCYFHHLKKNTLIRGLDDYISIWWLRQTQPGRNYIYFSISFLYIW